MANPIECRKCNASKPPRAFARGKGGKRMGVCRDCWRAALSASHKGRKKGRKKKRGVFVRAGVRKEIEKINARLRKQGLGVVSARLSDMARTGLMPEVCNLFRRMVRGGIRRIDMNLTDDLITIVTGAPADGSATTETDPED